MKEPAQLLNDMRAAGVIENYALFGAMAQMRYTEAVATLDADVLVGVKTPERMDVLADICGFCAQRGFHPDADAIRVGAQWQRSRQTLSWPEKVRLAEAIRASLIELRRTRPGPSRTASSRTSNEERPAGASGD